MNEKMTVFINKIKYETTIFIFLLISGLTQVKNIFQVQPWPFAFYLLDYDQGFGSRLLIGTIFNKLFNGFLKESLMSIIMVGFTALVCLIVSIILGKLIKRAYNTTCKAGIVTLILLYLAAPSKISTYFNSFFIGYLEIYIFPLVLAMIYLFITRRQNILFWSGISILCYLSMATHQGFLSLMFPIILAIMIYNLYEKNYDKKTIIGTLLVCSVTAASFIYFQFFAHLNVDCNTLVSLAKHKTDLNYPDYYIKRVYDIEYFQTSSQKFSETMSIAFSQLFKPEALTVALMLYCPLLLFFGKIWKDIIKQSTQKALRINLILIPPCGLLFLPMFAMACDWGRWTTWFITFQFSILFYLYWKQSSPVISAIQTFGEFASENAFWIGMYLIILSMFHMNLFNICVINIPI